MVDEKRSFGEYLVDLGVITSEQLKKALQEQRRGERLEQVLVRLKFASEEVVLQHLADYFDLPYVDLDTYLIDEQVLELIPEELARRHTLIPLFKIGETLTIALSNPLHLTAIDEVRNRIKTDVDIALSTEKKILRAIDQHYGAVASQFQKTLNQWVQQGGGPPPGSADYRKTYDLVSRMAPGEVIDDVPAARLFDLVMTQAIRDRASDIHIEPDEKSLRIRFRIDGFLYEFLTLPKTIHPPLTSRIKVLAEMDIAETRLPQDGNFNVRLERRNIEIRVSTFPTIYGENVVLRLLDQTTSLMKLEDLGFSDQMLERFKQLLQRPHGMILVTGPTGSGKTTTLYASLNLINSPEKNIITIEDPVEYRLPLIRQTQINPKAGITFAGGLRSILRQDPDVIMVGEIRDRETADVALQAALTGHLVLSTLHTNDAPEAITRLMDIGVEPYLIASSLLGVLAQRLVRKICSECKTSYRIDPSKINPWDGKRLEAKESLTLYRGKGCKSCKQSGYWGRVGLYELLEMSEELRQLISERAPIPVLRKVARETLGMTTLREDGLKKVLEGTTTLEEVNRVA